MPSMKIMLPLRKLYMGTILGVVQKVYHSVGFVRLLLHREAAITLTLSKISGDRQVCAVGVREQIRLEGKPGIRKVSGFLHAPRAGLLRRTLAPDSFQC